MKNCINLWCVLLLVMFTAIALGAEFNAIDYWNTQGIDKLNQGDYSGAQKCFQKAHELGNQTNSPIASDEISVKCGYKMDVRDRNDRSLGFSKVSAVPISIIKGQPNPNSEDLNLNFDITNHNDMEMRIRNIYINVIGYNSTINSNFKKEYSVIRSLGYFCDIEPALGSYKCIPLSFNEDNEYIGIDSNKMENINIIINTDTPGVYQLRISLDYAIGSENNTIVVGDVPERIGFFVSPKKEALP